MANLVLVRHGQTEWSKVGRHTGLTDLPLTSAGEEQARTLAPIFQNEHIDLVLTSPLRRAATTAALAMLPTPQVDADLAEWDYGGYEGLTTAEIREQLGRSWSVFADGVPPGTTPGESLEQVSARADRVLVRVRPLIDDGRDVALVGHGHQLRILAARWLGLAPVAGALLLLDAGSLSRLSYERGVSVIRLWNSVPGS